MKLCRVCKKISSKKIGEYKPYLEYKFDIFECENCGSRFVNRDKAIFEKLHRNKKSPYRFQDDLLEKIKKYYDKNDIKNIEKTLCNVTKYKFIVNNVNNNYSINNKILEIGCSKGYLTSYFLLKGYNIIGTDISDTAIKKSISNFGNHFKLIKNNNFSEFGKFDMIYHAGTIGCVDDPINFTKKLLDILNPNGILLFNVPDIQAVKEMNAIWTKTPPPDLITIFSEKIWKKYFSKKYNLRISYRPYDYYLNFKKNLMIFLNKPYLNPNIKSIFNTNDRKNKLLFNKMKNLLLKILTPFTYKFLKKYRNEYGMFVCITKK